MDKLIKDINKVLEDLKIEIANKQIELDDLIEEYQTRSGENEENW